MIDDHKHCIVCGKPVEPNKTICSPSCEEIVNQQQKKMKRSKTMMLILFIVMFVVILLMSYLPRILSPAT